MSDETDRETVSPLRSYLELLRLPNIFTAMADVAMGFFFVQMPRGWDDTGGLSPLGLWVLGLLVASSSFLYAAGVVLNDVFDLDQDRLDRPGRPLPSGRISLRAARWLGWELLLLGTVVPCGVAVMLRQPRPAVIVSLLTLAIVTYNVGLKRTIFGPLLMGACRMLNVLLGMSVLQGAMAAQHALVAGAVGIYITGVTWFAREDANRSDRRQLVAAALVMAAGIALLGWLPRWSNDLIWMISQDPGNWRLMVALFGAIILMRCLWAIALPVPGRVRVAVAQAIFSLVFLDAAVCYAARGPYWASLILLLLLPAVFLGRWIEGT